MNFVKHGPSIEAKKREIFVLGSSPINGIYLLDGESDHSLAHMHGPFPLFSPYDFIHCHNSCSLNRSSLQ